MADEEKIKINTESTLRGSNICCYRGNWDVSTTYQKGEIVQATNLNFALSLKDSNTAFFSDLTAWQLVSPAEYRPATISIVASDNCIATMTTPASTKNYSFDFFNYTECFFGFHLQLTDVSLSSCSFDFQTPVPHIFPAAFQTQTINGNATIYPQLNAAGTATGLTKNPVTQIITPTITRATFNFDPTAGYSSATHFDGYLNIFYKLIILVVGQPAGPPVYCTTV